MGNINQYYQRALELDSGDLLAGFSSSFSSSEDSIYLDGNSLGRLPIKTSELINEVVNRQWGDRLIRSWNENWMELSRRIAGKIAKIIGAREDEVFVGDTTTLNLYKIAYAALKISLERSRIVSDEFNFPADLYVLQGLVEKHFPGYEIDLLKSRDGIGIDINDLSGLVDNETALITLSHVAFKSSFMYDMKKVNELALSEGVMVLWDLSHAAGAVPLNLNESGAELAVGCTYKYLNGGPGAPAFLYVRRDIQEKLGNPIWSWFSHEKPFDFDHRYFPDPGIQKFAIGTPPVLSTAAIEPGLDLILEAGMDKLREKSLEQSEFFIEMLADILGPLGFSLASPVDPGIRGSHISIKHPEGYRINRAMIEPEGDSLPVIPDFRPPDNIRIGIAPLYNSFMDLYYAVERIKEIVESREFERFGNDRLGVT